jgi:hypothetical protein
MAKAGRFSDSPENRKRCSGGLGRSSKHHTTTDRGTPTAAGAPVLAENRGAAGPDRRRERARAHRERAKDMPPQLV